jgi:hypothetical protein
MPVQQSSWFKRLAQKLGGPKRAGFAFMRGIARPDEEGNIGHAMIGFHPLVATVHCLNRFCFCEFA